MFDYNFSTKEYLRRRLGDVEPSMIFSGENPQEWAVWREGFLSKLIEAMGPFPSPVGLDIEVIWEREEEGFNLRKIAYRAEADSFVPAYLLLPHAPKPAGGFPGLLCCHGHGSGKDNVVGITTDPEGKPCAIREEQLRFHNYDYARQFARRGYVCLAPDWHGFGERASEGYWDRDSCNVNFIIGSLIGFNLLTLDVNDAMRGIDLLAETPEVNGEKIGCLGLSFGGTMTTFTAAVDTRIKAACISGYLSPWKTHIFPTGGICGSQYLPGLMRYGDIPEIAALIAPRPLLIERGIKDSCFPVEGARIAANRVRKVYQASGHEERFEEDEFEGEHAFHGSSAFNFFDKNLKAECGE